MTKKKLLLVIVPLVVTGAICAGYFALRGGSEKGVSAPEQKVQSEKKRVDREALLAELAKKRGGLPIDLALKEAKTPEAKAFLERDLAYQRQTRAQAADEARTKLSEIESRLKDASDDTERSRLQNQKRMLEDLIGKLEGSTP